MGLTASVEYLRIIMNFAPQFGMDPDYICQQADFDPSILEKHGVRISADQFAAIWDVLEETNTDPDLGLHIGEKISIFPGHILFMLMLNASTIKDAIDKLCQYFNLLIDFSIPCFIKTASHSSLTIRYNSDVFRRTRHCSEGIFSAYASMLHRISEGKIQFKGVYFIHPRPADISEYQRIFKAPLFFDQKENKLIFENKYLALPVLLSDRNNLAILEKLAKKLQEKLYAYSSWSEKVSHIILDMLKHEKAEIESIARKLATSPRNLQNYLKKEGVTYQKLLDHIRKEQGMDLLDQKNIPISEVAFLLGYSEQSVFSRAFKRWTGMTPGQYRSTSK